MTINIKVINEDTSTTRSVMVDSNENGNTVPGTRIPAGGEATFMIHNTKSLVISEMQHDAVADDASQPKKETVLERIEDAITGKHHGGATPNTASQAGVSGTVSPSQVIGETAGQNTSAGAGSVGNVANAAGTESAGLSATDEPTALTAGSASAETGVEKAPE